MVAAQNAARMTPATAAQRVVAGDIGGTNARLWLAQVEGTRIEPLLERIFEVADIGGPEQALMQFANACRDAGLALGADSAVRRACLGVAGPVAGRRVRLTNSGWELDAQRIARQLGLDEVRLVNDFEAAAAGIGALDAADLSCLQAGLPQPGAPRVVIGAGTGLGVALLLGAADRAVVVPGEAGHAGFAPIDPLQAALWTHLQQASGRVEVEHVVSGPGLVRIWRFLVASGRFRPDATTEALVERDQAAAIARLAGEADEPSCAAALDLFLRAFGAAAGDHALSVLARGGVYVAGGIAPKLLPVLRDGRFIEAFRDKGRFAPLAADFPVHVVTDERLGLLGAAALAAGSAASAR